MANVEFVEPEDPDLRSPEYAQAVRLGDRIEISGQGGWTRTRDFPPTVREEIVQALDNVESVLAGAGASWDDVIAVMSYHATAVDPAGAVDAVGPDAASTVMSDELRRRIRTHAPIWTRVGVPRLGPRMHVEVRVTATAPEGSRESRESRRSDVAKPEFFVTPGYGDDQLDRFHYSQAVRIGNRIETAGQGGWSDDWEFPESRHDEIVQAFDNVSRTLATAGASWADVVSVSSWHTHLGDEDFESMVGELRARIPSHAPIWTCVGVTRLGLPKMRIEIAVTAVVDGD
jgi:enamine deaminase RidA (YjgF/YER057c/UK114 family)